jgi:ubiquinone/menaquinone biosynthesis C-methylase UbiE
MNNNTNRLCPVERAGHLDNIFRRWIQNPQKILKPYLKEGMTALDLGCGPGFFSIDMAKMVGKSGRVIASDLQEGMLQKLKNKIQGTALEKRIQLHKCNKDKIGVTINVDFVLAFYMVHEVPRQDLFFAEIDSILNPNGRLFIVEPPFHVSKSAFEQAVRKAVGAGLTEVERPKVFLSKTVMMKKA